MERNVDQMLRLVIVVVRTRCESKIEDVSEDRMSMPRNEYVDCRDKHEIVAE